MPLLEFKIIFAMVTLGIALIGGLWPFIKKYSQQNMMESNYMPEFPMGEALARGIFIGAGVLHMLPEATISFYKAGYFYPFPFFLAGAVYLLLLFLEHFSHHHTGKIFTTSSITLLTVAMLSMHAALEGAAVGLTENILTATIIFIAIIAHKGAESFALSLNINRSYLSLPASITFFSFFTLMTPIGIMMGNWIVSTSNHHTLLTPILSSLAAGTFLYIGTIHANSKLVKQQGNNSSKKYFMMLMGMIIMAIVAIWT